MAENYRRFEAGPDPEGTTWLVEFLWQQTAVSIRHSDSVDVKFAITCGELRQEKVIALMRPLLEELAKKLNRDVTDAWCMKLAATHLVRMIETGEDMDKAVSTPSLAELEDAARALAGIK
ncbi:MAG: hypothetical protein LLG20_19555 [Acidobacteriales bacterium]|nr:hypothetical protein [Terriglobales bacterium]